jgi:hypothetical protein
MTTRNRSMDCISFGLRTAVIAVSCVAAAAIARGGQISFEGFLFPDNVVVNSNRSLTFCLVNQGSENELIREGGDDDHLTLTIPLGPEASDLEVNGWGIGCVPSSEYWECSVDVQASHVAITVGPYLGSVVVPRGDTACFELTGFQINSAEGISFQRLEQFVHPSRALPAETRSLVVFKSANGVVLHDDLAGVRSNQHHVKTTSFGELTDQASDDQIPNDITISFAQAAGNADAVDGATAADLEESAEIVGSIAAHAAIADVHHARYTDAEARAALGGGFTGYEIVRSTSLGHRPPAICTEGKIVVGGGCSGGLDRIVDSRPRPDGDGWVCQFFTDDFSDADGFAWAICVNDPNH